MWVRFDCPSCGRSHSFDMPETTIYMTCSYTHETLKVRLTGGGDVKSDVVDSETEEGAEQGASND